MRWHFDRRWVVPGLVIGLVVLGVFCFNCFCPDDHDTLSYAFAGQNSTYATTHRVSSLTDVVHQQARDYMNPPGNGRVIVHGITALFAGFRLWKIFDVLNTGVWALFTWLALRSGGLRLRQTSPWGWAMGWVGVWWFLWRGDCTLNIAFALNYLWPATATVLLLSVWRRFRWWMVPLAFVYGWSQECFVVPMVAALAAEMALRSWRERRVACTLQQVTAWVLMTCGCALLCLGPASRYRAGSLLDTPLLGFVLGLFKSQIQFFLSLAPMFLLVGLLVIAWRKRNQWASMFWKSALWWLYLAFAYGSLLAMAHKSGSGRVAMPTLLAAVILLLRHCHLLRVPRWIGAAATMGALLWMGGALWVQFRLGREQLAMVQRYRANPQGITYWTPVHTWCFYADVWNPGYGRFHTMVIALECGRTAPVAVFSPKLYNTLYCRPGEFFCGAVPIPETSCYVHPGVPRVAIARGNATLTALERNLLLRQLQTPDSTSRPFSLLPGRFRMMLSCRDDAKLLLPHDKFVFRAEDGEQYTIFSFDKVPPPGQLPSKPYGCGALPP